MTEAPAKPPASDLALLVARAQCGHAGAVDALLRQQQAPLFRHIRSITGDPDLALDVLQDSMLLIVRRLPSLRDPRWFRAWAYRIATREAVRKASHERRARSLCESENDPADAPPGVQPERLTPAEIRAQIESLTPASQLVVRMHYLEEMTFAEIAEALEIPIGTVKSRTAYALGTLRDRLIVSPTSG